MDHPPVPEQVRVPFLALGTVGGDPAVFHSMPAHPPHELGSGAVGACYPGARREVFGRHETVCEVSAGPEDCLDVDAESRFRQGGYLAVQRELIIEPEHQYDSAISSLSSAITRSVAASWISRTVDQQTPQK